jgi:hypothetical protein
VAGTPSGLRAHHGRLLTPQRRGPIEWQRNTPYMVVFRCHSIRFGDLGWLGGRIVHGRVTFSGGLRGGVDDALVESLVGRGLGERAVDHDLLERDVEVAQLLRGVAPQRVLGGVPDPGLRPQDEAARSRLGIRCDLVKLIDVAEFVGLAELARAAQAARPSTAAHREHPPRRRQPTRSRRRPGRRSPHPRRPAHRSLTHPLIRGHVAKVSWL